VGEEIAHDFGEDGVFCGAVTEHNTAFHVDWDDEEAFPSPPPARCTKQETPTLSKSTRAVTKDWTRSQANLAGTPPR
jgi:hypothetical protein